MYYIAILGVLIVLFLPHFQLVKGSSKEPTLKDGQFILSVIPSRIERMDIVTIKTNNGILVKRVVGIPGDTVQIKNGRACINNNVINDIVTDYAGVTVLPVYLGDGEYFVLGDIRNNSRDSRCHTAGVVNERQILRKVIIVE